MSIGRIWQTNLNLTWRGDSSSLLGPERTVEALTSRIPVNFVSMHVRAYVAALFLALESVNVADNALCYIAANPICPAVS